MAIGINDLDDDDILTLQEEINNPQEQEESTPSQLEPEEENDFVSDFLRSKGIEDPSKIKFEDENGDILERDWNDLTKEEQINILNTPVEMPILNNEDNGLTDEEVELLNTIRESNLTPQQYISLLQGEPVEPTYKIDDLSDDELFLLDLESRVGELDEEQASQALSLAKQNEDLYQKQVNGIRKEYKEREDFQLQQEQAQLELQQAQAFLEYQAKIVDAIDLFKAVGNLDLNFEDSDKDELADFMLSQDESGNNYLYQALQDPETLVKAAWFILNGDEAINNISDYFVNLIKLISENQYKKGYLDGKNGTSPTRPVVVTKKTNVNHPIYKTIDDLDD